MRGRNRLESIVMAGTLFMLATASAQAQATTKVFFESYRAAAGNYDIFKVNPDGSQEQNITSQYSSLDRCPTLCPDGRTLVFATNRNDTGFNVDLWTMKTDGTNPQPLYGFSGVHEYVPDCGNPYIGGAQVLFERLIFPGNSDVWKVNTDGTGATNLTATPLISEGQASWCANQIVFVSEEDTPGTQQVFVMDHNGSNKRRISCSGKVEQNPTCSADGQSIAFARLEGSIQQNDYNIYRVAKCAGSCCGGENQLTTDPAADEFPSFSPGGTAIAFHSYRGPSGDRRVYQMDALEGEGQDGFLEQISGLNPPCTTGGECADSDPDWVEVKQ